MGLHDAESVVFIGVVFQAWRERESIKTSLDSEGDPREVFARLGSQKGLALRFFVSILLYVNICLCIKCQPFQPTLSAFVLCCWP